MWLAFRKDQQVRYPVHAISYQPIVGALAELTCSL
jgi:hypothetical protein